MNIKAYRKKLGLTQTDLANKLGVTLKTVQNYESNAVTVPRKKIELMADIFKVSIEDLYKEEHSENKKVNLLEIDREEIASFIYNNWDYMMKSNLFNANFKAKAGEWLLMKKKELEGIK